MSEIPEVQSVPSLLGGASSWLLAMPIVMSEHAMEWRQVRFPKSKKKRIRRKWAKRAENWANVPMVILAGRHLVGHPDAIRILLDRARSGKPWRLKCAMRFRVGP